MVNQVPSLEVNCRTLWPRSQNRFFIHPAPLIHQRRFFAEEQFFSPMTLASSCTSNCTEWVPAGSRPVQQEEQHFNGQARNGQNKSIYTKKRRTDELPGVVENKRSTGTEAIELAWMVRDMDNNRCIDVVACFNIYLFCWSSWLN